MRIVMVSLIMFFAMASSRATDLWAAESFRCYADQAATTGFYPKEAVKDIVEKGKIIEMKLEHYPMQKQPTGGGYQIRLGTGIAEVFDEVTNDTYQYQISSRNGSQIILVRQKGVGVETITIDESNNSFIQTDVVINPLYHRTVVWVGYCESAANRQTHTVT